MPTRSAHAVWNGDLKQGSGTVKVDSGLFEGPYSFPSRFEEGDGTNPEELVGAALASCFSMFLASLLAKAGHTAERVATEARVHLGTVDGGPRITRIELVTEAAVPGIDEDAFQQQVKKSKEGCPVSQALAATPIEVRATLTGA